MPRWARLLRHAPEASVLAVLAGLVVWTIRAGLHDPDPGRVWATITAWALVGIPTVMDLHHYHVHGHLPQRRSHKWQ